MKTRRDFIKNTGLLVAGSSFAAACTPTAKEGKNESGDENSKVKPATLKAVWPIGLQLYTLRNELKEDVAATIKYVGETGYQHLELFGYKDRKYFGRCQTIQ